MTREDRAAAPPRALAAGRKAAAGDGAGPEQFRQAVAQVQAGARARARLRPELTFEPEPAPRRLAPFAHALGATLSDGRGRADADADAASGKFVLLFDEAGQPGWDGKHRIIGYVRAELEPEIAADPLICEVGWSWLTEALDGHASGYSNISGTVTTVVTQGFGSKQDEPVSTGFELRASWTPLVSRAGSAGLDGHVAAWCEVIAAAAGLPPAAAGVAPLRRPGQPLRPRA